MLLYLVWLLAAAWRRAAVGAGAAAQVVGWSDRLVARRRVFHRDAVRMARRSGGRRLHVALGAWLPGWDFGLQLDRLSLIWTLIITGVGFLIHVYSIGYMAGDRAFARFFAYMNFFVFAMLTLVLSDNVIGLLVGWGLVGLASYFLIGFWFYKPTAVAAARKAFVINVVGDVGIMFAIFIIVAKIHSIGYADIFARFPTAFTPHDAVPGLPGPVHRLRGEVGADPAAHLVARRDGRPDPGLGADPRRHDGDRRRLPGGALRAAVVGLARRARAGRRDRRADGARRRDPRHRAVGHQTHPGLLDDVADRLHDHGRRRRRVRCRRAALLHARVLQGAALPGRGHRHPRAGQRAGRAPHGRAAQAAAVRVRRDVRRRARDLGRPRPQRVLQQGRGGVRRARERASVAVRGRRRSPPGSPRTTCSACCSSRSSARIAATSIRAIWGSATPSWPEPRPTRGIIPKKSRTTTRRRG